MSDRTRRTAACSCGQFTITTHGEPAWVNLCNCLDCQRRSGSAFHVAAFFPDTQIDAIAGARTAYARPTRDGRTLDLEFCPTCGVSVLFRLKMRPGYTAIHVGCFADPDFPPPTKIWFSHRAHPWVVLPEGEIVPPPE
jgi:hypothetical protein